MEAEDLTLNGRIHHGRNIKRTRIEKNIKQDALCDLVHLSQSAISKYEKMRVIDDEMLQRFAKALDVPVEELKELEEEVPMVVFENNTSTNNVEATTSNNGGNINTGLNNEYTGSNENIIHNPLDKVNELFERLLKEKDERIALLEEQLREWKQK